MRVCSVCRRCYDDSVAVCGDEMHPPLSDVRDGSLDGIAGYRIETLIESGVGGEIYRAVRSDSGQSCLVRLLSADEKTTEQFSREAKLAASLFHPSIVDTYEVGSLDSGEVFVVSEDADGRTLREFLDDRGTPELLTSIEIIRQAAEALHTLHQSGFTHGAVRPENIVLTTDRERGLLVRIQHLDFGGVIARSIISNKFLIDSALNSLRYFAPEQCSGAERSAQADVYSLGIVFYELLAGAPPFDASKAVGLIEKHRSQTVPDIRIDNFELRMLVTHSLMESLQKQPRTRQSSADLFARQLRHIEQLATHTSTPPPAGVVPEPRVIAKPTPVRNAVPSVIEVRDPAPHVIAAKTESEPVTLREVESELLPVMDSLAEKPVPAPTPIYVTPRSRLKLWKKKLHSIATRVAAEKKTGGASIFSGVDRESLGQASAEPPTAQNTIEPPHRKKIEWVTPEDDIPSEAAVIEVRAKEGIAQFDIPLAPVKESEIAPPIVEAAKIEAPVVEAAKVEAPAVEAPIVEARKIGGVEIPTVEKLREVETIDTPAVPKPITVAKPKETAPNKVSSTPVTRVIPRKKPAVPERVAPVAVISEMDADTIRPTTRTRPSSPQRSGLGFKVNLEDLEEITLVRPPSKRIKIDWDRAVARPDLSNFNVERQPRTTAPREIVFSPTILGGAPEPKMVERRRGDGMFGSYSVETSGSGSIPYRSMALGGVITVVIGLVLFSSDSVTKYFQTWSSADSVTVSMRSAGEDANAAGSTATPQVKQRALKNSETRGPKIAAEKSLTEKLRASNTATVAPKVSPVMEARASASEVMEARASASETKKRKPADESAKKMDVKKVLAASKSKPGVSTRPRIVDVQN